MNYATGSNFSSANSPALYNNKGRFYSPQYPSTYPRNVICNYIFNGGVSTMHNLFSL